MELQTLFLANHNKDIRPIVNQTKPIVLFVQLEPHSILNFNEVS